jgi:hypothetical protein
MNKFLITAVSACVLSGCAQVSLQASSESLGGKSDEKWGVVQIVRTAGFKNAEDKKARRIMTEYCAPQDYKVKNTGSGSGPSAVVMNKPGAVMVGTAISANKVTINFTCVD